MQQGDQQEWDVRDENRAAGQEQDALAGCAARANRIIGPAREGPSGPVPAGVPRMSPGILAPFFVPGATRACRGTYSFPAGRISA